MSNHRTNETININGETKLLKKAAIEGNYHNICVYCNGYMINADKRCYICAECIPAEEDKI